MVLPNLRLLAHHSENAGTDWIYLETKITDFIRKGQFDLESESVYILYRYKISEVIDGRDDALVAKPVIGFKKEVEPPFKLIDLKQVKVKSCELKQAEWGRLFNEAFEFSKKLEKESRKDYPVFMLHIQRELTPKLKSKVSAIFSE